MQCAATFDRGRRTNDQKEGKSVSVRKRYSGCLRDWKGTKSGAAGWGSHICGETHSCIAAWT